MYGYTLIYLRGSEIDCYCISYTINVVIVWLISSVLVLTYLEYIGSIVVNSPQITEGI